MKKLLSFVLLALTALLLFGCGEKNAEPPGETETGYDIIEPDTESKKQTSQNYLNQINNVDPEGDFFTVATTGFDLKTDNDSVSYSNALSERCKIVEDKFGTRISELVCADPDTMLSDLYTSYLSGVYYSDIMVIPVSAVADFAAKGMLMNVNSLPFADYSAPYFDPDAMEQFTVGKKVYAASGDFNRDIGSYYCLFVNRSILDECGIKMPFDSVIDGTWTWDKLYEMIVSVNGINKSVKGIAYPDENEFADIVFASSGAKYLADNGNQPKASFADGSTADAVDAFRRIVKSGLGNNVSSSSTKFTDGDVLFFISTVDMIKQLSTTEISWCILPLPKLHESDETYFSRAASSYPVVTVPINNGYVEDTSYILSALNAASSGWLDDAYYDMLVEKYARDAYALNMLDYVCGIKAGRLSFDLAKTMSYRNGDIGAGTYGVIRDSGNFGDFESRYAPASELIDSIFLLYTVNIY